MQISVLELSPLSPNIHCINILSLANKLQIRFRAESELDVNTLLENESQEEALRTHARAHTNTLFIAHPLYNWQTHSYRQTTLTKNFALTLTTLPGQWGPAKWGTDSH